jgi:hypothetical protein
MKLFFFNSFPKILLLTLLLSFFSLDTFAQNSGSPLPPGLFGSGRPVAARYQALGIDDFTGNSSEAYSFQGQSLFVQPVDNKKVSLFFGFESGETQISNSDLVLEDGATVRNELEYQEFTAGYTIKSSKDSSWTLVAGYGSASDRLYERGADNIVRLSLVHVKSYKKSNWILGAFYNSNLNVGFNILPIIAYSYQPRKNLRMVVGIPFFNLTWGSFIGSNLFVLATPGGARAQFTYSLFGPLAVNTGVEWSNENFQHADRRDDEDQFIIERNLVYLGLRAPVFRGFMLNLRYGYRFNTKFFQAEGIFDDAEETFDLANSSFGELRLSFRF